MPPTQEFNDALAALVTAAEAKGARDFAAENPPVDPSAVTAEAQADDLAAVQAATTALNPPAQ